MMYSSEKKNNIFNREISFFSSRNVAKKLFKKKLLENIHKFSIIIIIIKNNEKEKLFYTELKFTLNSFIQR